MASAAPSKLGMPKPGVTASCSPITSPKKGWRPFSLSRVGEVTFFREGNLCGSELDLTPFVSGLRILVDRALAGDEGAGCGRSRGFRLLNLYEPYVSSLEGGAGAGDELVDATGGRTGRARVLCGDVSADVG